MIYHNSQEEFYRSPVGALQINSDLTLRIRTDLSIKKVYLHYWMESQGNVSLEMEEEMDDGSSKFFSLTINLGPSPQLLWYNFGLGDNEIFYGNNEDGLGGQGQVYQEEPLSYQVTIYKPSPVPEWFKNSVVYQIFPDRFNKSKDKDLSSCQKKDALIHLSWENDPYYIKNEKGQVVRWDFFAGDLKGIMEKVDYLKELGVNCLYLNPIFQARSNHRYDTGDYHKIDPMLGTNQYFEEMTQELEKAGIKVILDGVFSHTGADSIYFNRFENYDSLGAYNSQESIYFDWYSFGKHPDKYESWWGVEDLPAVNEMNPSYQDFIYNNPDGVVRYWLDKGAAGWRLDVVDELPGKFIKNIRRAAKETREDAVIIGEVWEDASNKVSYGKSREYLLGYELDSPTNYPLRAALISFVKGEIKAQDFHRKIMNLYENYPREHFYSAFNMLGSHDVERIASLVNPLEHKICLFFQMTFPGVPLVYYGDEAGLMGHKDPDNRKTYPWGRKDEELLDLYKEAIALRREEKIFVTGSFESGFLGDNIYYFIREEDEEKALVVINNSQEELAYEIKAGKDIFTGTIEAKEIKILQKKK